jgi:hypothetical protein
LPFAATRRKHGVPPLNGMRQVTVKARLWRIAGVLGAFSLLAACASTGSTSGGIPSVEPSYSGPLAGATPRQVEAQLGRPAIVRDEGNGALWTYRFSECALMVGFSGPSASRRVTDIETGPRQAGQAALSREACLASARR